MGADQAARVRGPGWEAAAIHCGAVTSTSPRALHRFAVALALGVIGLIAAGGLVKSLEAGLSVPDWPTSYGGINPPRWWEIRNVRAEHGHRLIAGTVALLTVGLAFWAQRREPRPWVRRLAWLAVVAVLAQALLGGLTVLFYLPTAISVSHAAVAELFLCLVVTLAVVTSPRWWAAASQAPAADALRRTATLTTVVVYVQILVGALVRHTGSGLAIPDFPLSFGHLVPPHWDYHIAIHFAHRLGALAVLVLVLLTAMRAFSSARGIAGILPATAAMVFLVLCQITLGATVVWSGRAVLPNTAHVAVGASLLAASLVLTLNCWRRPAGAAQRVAAGAGGAIRDSATDPVAG